VKSVRLWLFVLIAAISLIVCVATVAIWIRSEWYGDQVVWDGSTHQLRIESMPGGISFLLDVHTADPNLPPGGARVSGAAWGSPVFTSASSIVGRHQIGTFQPGKLPWMHHGFGLWHEAWSDTHVQYAAAMPFWSLTIITAILPLLAAQWIIEHRGRRVRGRCAKCGYDLRATPDRSPSAEQFRRKVIIFQTAPLPIRSLMANRARISP
jgi:hypothetical protein